MMTVCAECGKRIVVTWPEFYVYKRGKGEDTCYFCSENCMIVSDVRDTKERSGWNDEPWITEGELEAIQAGRKPFRMLRRPTSRNSRPPAEKDRPEKPAERTGQDMGNNKSSHKLTREEKEKAVEIAIGGGDPLDWLRTCGAKNPSAAWFYIKKTVAKADPKLYEKIPEKPGMVINESGQAVPAAETEKADDALAGFQPLDVKQRRAPQTIRKEEIYKALGVPAETVAEQPEVDLTIKAEDLQAAEDPAVARMEAMAEIAEKVPDVDAGERPAAVARDPSTSVGMTAQGVLKERSELIHDAHGVRMVTERLLDDLPCVITGLKVNEFEFNLNRAGMVLILPESDRDFLQLQVTLRPDQWRRLVEVVPKVMKIFGMD